MSAINFTSLHEIRREAGLVRQTTDNRVIGKVDGTNREFYANHAPIVDRNNDDIVTTADVTCYVDGEVVIAQAVEAASGKVVLANPPERDAVVELAYEHSAADDTEVEKRRSNAQNWLRRRVKAHYNLNEVTSDNFPDAWEDAVRLRAAGMLQISDWGTNIDTDGSSRDGYQKIKLASQIIDEWIKDAGGVDPDDPHAVPAGQARHVSDGDFVGRVRGGRHGHSIERRFHNFPGGC